MCFVQEVIYQRRPATSVATWKRKKAVPAVPKIAFPTSMKTGVGWCLLLSGVSVRAKHTSIRDFVCSIIYWLAGTIWKISRLSRLIVGVCIQYFRPVGTSTSVPIFCLFEGC